MLIGVAGKQPYGISEQAQACLSEQQDRQDGLEHGMGIGVIDPVRGGEQMFVLGGKTG